MYSYSGITSSRVLHDRLLISVLGKRREGKGREGKGREGKGMEWKGREEKRRYLDS
jgi:hypothetical protein